MHTPDHYPHGDGRPGEHPGDKHRVERQNCPIESLIEIPQRKSLLGGGCVETYSDGFTVQYDDRGELVSIR